MNFILFAHKREESLDQCGVVVGVMKHDPGSLKEEKIKRVVVIKRL